MSVVVVLLAYVKKWKSYVFLSVWLLFQIFVIASSLNLSSNNLCSVTETDYIKASKVQGASFNVGDKVMYERKEMIVSQAKDSDGDIKMTNLPDLSGVNAIADALRVCAVADEIGCEFQLHHG